MDQLENDLKDALRRVEPPAGFEQRVFARLARESSPRKRFTTWATAAGLAFASLGGIVIYQQQQQQRKAEEAHEKLVLALRITGQKLDVIRARINTSSNE
jgi:hypothetical protein